MSRAVGDNLRTLIAATEHEAECTEARRKAEDDLQKARAQLRELSHHDGPGLGLSYGVGSNVPVRHFLIDDRYWKVTWVRLGDDHHRVEVEPIRVEVPTE